MTPAIFCPVCRGVIFEEPWSKEKAPLMYFGFGYTRLETVCPSCKHRVMIHDFGRE